MAQNPIPVTPGTGRTVDAYDAPGGAARQTVLLGNRDTAEIADVTAQGVAVKPAADNAAVTSRVPAATASTQLLAANTARLTCSVFNDSSSELYLKYGTGASSTSKKLKILAGGYWEMPPGCRYTGVIHGAWAVANGAADVTEET